MRRVLVALSFLAAMGIAPAASADCSGGKPDGRVEPGEACDPDDLANPSRGECCSSTCTAMVGDACDGHDECTSGQCTRSGRCQTVAKREGTACDDGTAGTQTDTCKSGQCVGNRVACTASDQCHDAGTCTPADGKCSDPAKTDGTTCNDENACTQTDTCQTG